MCNNVMLLRLMAHGNGRRRQTGMNGLMPSGKPFFCTRVALLSQLQEETKEVCQRQVLKELLNDTFVLEQHQGTE